MLGGRRSPPTVPIPEPAAGDDRWMAAALAEAAAAGARGEVPIGAVVVRAGRLLARAGNDSVAARDPTGHAEVRALRAAARRVRSYRLPGVTLYVTVEPCVMCVGAALHARVKRLVFGCADPKGGAAGSSFDLTNEARLNHRLAVTSGVAAGACRALVQDFFRTRRGSDRRGRRRRAVLRTRPTGEVREPG